MDEGGEQEDAILHEKKRNNFGLISKRIKKGLTKKGGDQGGTTDNSSPKKKDKKGGTTSHSDLGPGTRPLATGATITSRSSDGDLLIAQRRASLETNPSAPTSLSFDSGKPKKKGALVGTLSKKLGKKAKENHEQDDDEAATVPTMEDQLMNFSGSFKKQVVHKKPPLPSFAEGVATEQRKDEAQESAEEKERKRKEEEQRREEAKKAKQLMIKDEDDKKAKEEEGRRKSLEEEARKKEKEDEATREKKKKEEEARKREKEDAEKKRVASPSPPQLLQQVPGGGWQPVVPHQLQEKLEDEKSRFLEVKQKEVDEVARLQQQEGKKKGGTFLFRRLSGEIKSNKKDVEEDKKRAATLRGTTTHPTAKTTISSPGKGGTLREKVQEKGEERSGGGAAGATGWQTGVVLKEIEPPEEDSFVDDEDPEETRKKEQHILATVEGALKGALGDAKKLGITEVEHPIAKEALKRFEEEEKQEEKGGDGEDGDTLPQGGGGSKRGGIFKGGSLKGKISSKMKKPEKLGEESPTSPEHLLPKTASRINPTTSARKMSLDSGATTDSDGELPGKGKKKGWRANRKEKKRMKKEAKLKEKEGKAGAQSASESEDGGSKRKGWLKKRAGDKSANGKEGIDERNEQVIKGGDAFDGWSDYSADPMAGHNPYESAGPNHQHQRNNILEGKLGSSSSSSDEEDKDAPDDIDPYKGYTDNNNKGGVTSRHAGRHGEETMPLLPSSVAAKQSSCCCSLM